MFTGGGVGAYSCHPTEQPTPSSHAAPTVRAHFGSDFAFSARSAPGRSTSSRTPASRSHPGPTGRVAAKKKPPAAMAVHPTAPVCPGLCLSLSMPATVAIAAASSTPLCVTVAHRNTPMGVTVSANAVRPPEVGKHRMARASKARHSAPPKRRPSRIACTVPLENRTPSAAGR
jgi:hypothetical protein